MKEYPLIIYETTLYNLGEDLKDQINNGSLNDLRDNFYTKFNIKKQFYLRHFYYKWSITSFLLASDLEDDNLIIMAEQVGLAMSSCVDIQFSPSVQPSGFSIIKYFWGPTDNPTKKKPLDFKLFQIHHKFHILIANNQMSLLSIDNGKEGKAQLSKTIKFDDEIKYMSSNWLVPFQNVLVAVASKNQVFLFNLDFEHKQLIRRSNIKIKDINSMVFINGSNLWVINKHSHLTELQCGKLRLIKTKQLGFDIGKTSPIHHGILVTPEVRVKEYHLFYFFFTRYLNNASGLFVETIYVKELVKKSDDSLLQGSVFKIKEIQCRHEAFNQVDIKHNASIFWLTMQDQIVLIKKKQNSYYFMDTIRKKTQSTIMKLLRGNTLCVIADSSAELSHLVIKEPKCIVEVFDMVIFDLPDDYQIFEVVNIQDSYMFLFRSKTNPFKVKITFTYPEEAMTKVVQCYAKGIQLPVIDHLTKVLNIPKKNFYLKLWHNSNKDIEDIRMKLMLCGDIFTIKEEMKFTLRKKTNSISEVIEIYGYLYELIRARLTECLDIKVIKIAVEHHFLLRKLKTLPDKSVILGLKQFSQIKNKPVIKMIQEAINNQNRISLMQQRERQKIRKNNPILMIKAQTIIKDIVQQFRYIMMQNYENNLIQLIKPFRRDLDRIFDKFSFLLPMHPHNFQFQGKQLVRTSSSLELSLKKSKSQQQYNIFQNMGEFQLQSEMSIIQIKNYLLQYHPTSAVEAAISQFIADEAFRKQRLQRHGVIYSTMPEYIAKVKQSVSGIRLYLKVLQFSNLMNSKEDQDLDLDKLVEALVEVFKKKNGLAKQQLINIRLFGRLHALLIQKNFDPIPSMDSLTTLKSDELISLFFLGNRHKINLIFNQLKHIYDTVTENDSIFINTIKQFVESDSCSPVELRLLVFQVDKKGKGFQDKHQELIQSLINGFCNRMVVGEKDRIQQFADSLSNVSLCMSLNERVMNIIKIKQLDDIFKQFKCENQSLLSVEKQGLRILSKILQNYFVYQMYEKKLNIQEQLIDLQTPRNMLNVLIYLQEQLYIDTVTLEDVALLFGQRLVQYQAFDDLREFIHQEDTLQRMDISPVGYAEALIRQAFLKLYRQPGNFQQMKEYIHQILRLQVETTDYLQQQISRVQLCQLISDCNFEIHPAQVGYGPNKVEFMFNFIEAGYDSLSIQKITQIYYCFRGMQGNEQVEIGSELLTYINLFSKTCIKNQRVEAGIQGVIYLLKMDCLQQIRSLITEAFLQYVCQRFQQQTQQAWEMIQYFCMRQNNKEALIDLFSGDFDIQQQYDNEDQVVEVNEKLVYLKLKTIDMKVRQIRDISRKIGIIPKLTYRYYYFSFLMLFEPEQITIVQVPFNISSLDDLVDSLCKKLSVKVNYIGTNFNQFLFRRFFLNILCQLGCNIANEEQFKVDQITNFDDDLPLMNMIQKLKEADESILVRIIRKNIRYLQDNKVANEDKQKKAKKYQKAIVDQINAITIDTHLMAPSKNQEMLNSRSVVMDNLKVNMSKNMTLREFLSVTVNASMQNPTFNDRQIVSMIKQDNKLIDQTDKRQSSPMRPRGITIRHNNYQQFQMYLQQEYFQLFDNKKYYEVDCKDRQQMLKFLRQYYLTDRDLGNFIKLLQGLKLGQQRNIKIVQSAMRVHTANIDLKKLFKFQFYFFSPDSILSNDPKVSSNEFYNRVFEYLTPSINEIIKYDTWMMLSKIVCVSLKFQKQFEYRVILIALESFLADNSQLSNSFVSTLNEFFQKLSSSTIFLAKHYKEPLRSCDSKDIQKYYLQMVYSYLQNPDQSLGRIEDTQKQIIDQAMEDIQQLFKKIGPTATS